MRAEGALQTARRLGAVAGQMCLDFAGATSPGFSERAFEFIVAKVKSVPHISGEALVDAAIAEGIRPHDQRAFGPVFQRAIRQKKIKVVGDCARKKGHGTAGGRLYAAGECA